MRMIGILCVLAVLSIAESNIETQAESNIETQNIETNSTENNATNMTEQIDDNATNLSENNSEDNATNTKEIGAKEIGKAISLKENKESTIILKPNQTLIVNHNDNRIMYILEITSNGNVKKINLPKEFKGKKASDILSVGIVASDYDKRDRSGTIPRYNAPLQKSRKINDFRDRLWDKNKIIYEQDVEILHVK